MDRINKLKQLLENSPGDSFIQHALALEYVKLGDDVTAGRLFEGLLDKEPTYVGSYYHLAKLFERKNDFDTARKWYEKGMVEAKRAGENHAYGELRGAYEELIF